MSPARPPQVREQRVGKATVSRLSSMSPCPRLPSEFIIPPKATIPIVLVVSCLQGTAAPISCHPNLPFRELLAGTEGGEFG